MVNKSLNSIQTASSPRAVEAEEPIAGISQLPARRVMYDALVLDARLRQALLTIRSLGRRGLRVAAVGTSASEPAFSSRWCQQAFVCPAAEGSEAYVAYLEQLLDHTRARVLIPCSDATIALLRCHRERLEQRVRIALAQEPALGIAINKEQTLAAASRLGLGVPRAVAVTTVTEVGAALREIGLPAVIKPVESWSSNGQQGARIVSQLVTTAGEAYRAVEELTRFGGSTLFQEFLTGRRESLSFFYANGDIYARYAFWGKRTNPPLGGIYVLRQSIPVPEDTGGQAERLVREIDLEGYCQVEFRRDSLGKPYLMEINPRLNLGIEVAVRAGVDFPYLLYQWATEQSIERVPSYRVGGRMRYLPGDIAATIAAVQQRGRPGVPSPARAIFDFCLSFLTPTGYDYADWRDPLPAWTATVGAVRALLRLLLKKLGRL
jgi:predicted ATP-grasp superfamily ATP-dependent carboligase